MEKLHSNPISNPEQIGSISIFELIPIEVIKWTESLPWDQRRYVLSLCYLMCSVSLDKQAEFLDNYTADCLVLKMLRDQAPQELVRKSFKKFHIDQELSNTVLRNYIKQYYIHSAQDLRVQPKFDLEYLEVVLRLINSAEERSSLFNYILGSEIIKMLFQMSWLEHERLYRLQKNQEDFIKNYIKPIQHAHRINGIVVPKHENLFFAKRDFFIKKPNIKGKKLIELVMSTFTTDKIKTLGFLIIRNLDFLTFDYDYIFDPEPECIFFC
ncbi:MAG TPA: hypothetical protein DD379_16990 [Cyanobacteria bacterium UBA11162]|nr:hypothetical protein [Cyanobacteria bacterium UBA11162]